VGKPVNAGYSSARLFLLSPISLVKCANQCRLFLYSPFPLIHYSSRLVGQLKCHLFLINDTGGKIATGINNTSETGGKNLPPVSLIPVANLPPVSLIRNKWHFSWPTGVNDTSQLQSIKDVAKGEELLTKVLQK
jgi:hypothetical protein